MDVFGSVHDGYPGRAGFTARGFTAFETWIRATRDAVTDCRCETCRPSCVQSPKCGNGNEPLDKPGAIAVLDLILRELAQGPQNSSNRQVSALCSTLSPIRIG